ncbi:CRISPR-associated endonuclease Cas1 [Nocardiopsis lambiniae]|uniref:CRISPR-associated endonuclease Cas1 n=1 Tax=Nocardiopsis lambiniae TaxID=3075539 RepID=A0ABU2M2X0_9ACTN|nr:CRISPR-associated endonuclease Cas1 [Nocardiopsis sp. DSM 44743]MDT0326993.1 CRISPR-associated endonuclease Cas1 [Nocardiopsis sp. DSM 44743]
MGDLLRRVADSERLFAAWNEVRDNDLEDGVKSEQVREFERGALRNLTELSEQLAAGEYTPGPVVAIEVPKSSGGTRLLAIPAVRDRIVERAVLEVVEPFLDPVLSPWSFAYRSGLGVNDAIRALTRAREAGARWVVRADIEDCFERIPRWPVITRVRELVPDAELCLLLQHLVSRDATGPAAGRVRAGRRQGRGLHQGSALSPALTNLYLDAFDKVMLERGLQVLRYTDDFAIPADSRADAENALVVAGEMLDEWGLELNTDKSRIVSFDEGVVFLGRTVGAVHGAVEEDRVRPLEATVYVTTPGALVRSRGDRVRIEHGEEVLLSVNLKRVRQVVGVGRVGYSTPFLHRALRQGVELVLLDDLGRFQGRLSRALGGDVHVRAAQYETALDGTRAMEFARGFVVGKITNLRTAVLRASRATSAPDEAAQDASTTAERLIQARSGAMEATGLAELMGHEGAASRDYFACWGRMFPPVWGFTHRRRPPPDPVNAMLSFGYTLLLNDAVVACHVAGLDPEGGYLHSLAQGRASLALDLIEEFRPVVVDSVVTALVLGGKVAPEGFDHPLDEAKGCRMSPETLKVFLGAYEKRMLTLFRHSGMGCRVSYRTALTAQARVLADVLAGRADAYEPVVWR